jgi:DNA repair exonuclease SbcCD ATPase subunit
VEDGMRRAGFVVALVALTVCFGPGSVAAETGGRYTMSPTEDGMVRLDTQTGAMALCRRKDGAWACEDMEDSQRTLMGEIDKLRTENKSLKEQVEHLEETLGLGQTETDAPGPSAKLTLPSEADVDKAFDYLERMLNKLHERMEKLEEKHGRKPETEL